MPARDIIQAQYEPLETIAARFGRQAEASRSIETSVTRSLRSLQSGAAFFDEITGSVLPALARLAQALQQVQTITLYHALDQFVVDAIPEAWLSATA